MASPPKNTPTNRALKLTEGTLAPDFHLPDAEGQIHHLYETLRHHWVVLFFYPKDHTPGCTTEVCAFRDQFEAFLQAGAMVLGISTDSGASHQKFSQTHRLPFPLLIDTGGIIRKTYQVPKTWGLLPGRMTFVIAPDHTIRMTFNSQFDSQAHPKKALALIQAQEQNRSNSLP